MVDEPMPPPADPFPRDRVSVMLHRMPNYLKLTWRLGKDPMLSRARRAAVIAAAGYVISPVDLVPGVIPVLGQLDDIAVALVALRLALDGLHPDRRRAHLEAVGLSDAHLAEDLRTVGATHRLDRPQRHPHLRPPGARECPSGRGGRGAGGEVGRQGRQGAPAGGRIRMGAQTAPPPATERQAGRLTQAGSCSQSTHRVPSHQRCQVRPSVPAAKTSSRSALHELAAGVGPTASVPPSDSHACHAVPSQ